MACLQAAPVRITKKSKITIIDESLSDIFFSTRNLQL